MEESNIEFNHQVPIQVRFNDIDLLGHVNNAIMQEYFDLGRMHYLKDTFNTIALFPEKEVLVIASVNTNFLSPIYLQEEMVVQTKIEIVGNKSLKMRQHLTNKQTKEVKVTCESVMVAIDKSSSQSIEMPDDWRQLFGQIENKKF